MDSTTLQLFGRQIIHWAETVLSRGRHPFRRVETEPLLLTSGGECRPAAVFWINRESSMAGGVLLLPRKKAEDELERGRQCADALGLRHFVTWAPWEIAFWEDRGDAVVRSKTFPLEGRSEAAEGFQSGVTTILEELKTLCVLGAVSPRNLSPYYLANLCRSTMERVLPPLEEGYRAARSERPAAEQGSLAQLAFDKSLISLLRLLALVLYDRLPNTIQPEGLERAMLFALDTLPPPIQKILQPSTGESLLPTESAIRFHHLLRRLTQLQCGTERQRAALVLEILLDHYRKELGAYPLAAATTCPAGVSLLINPDRPCPGGDRIVEVGRPALLATLALIRELRLEPPAHAQSTDPLALTPPLTFSMIRGSLKDQSIPDAASRRLLTARLRSSWPTRRFALSRRTPGWIWAFMHLLGLADEGAQIDLDIPDDWLFEDSGEIVQQLLFQEYALHSIRRRTTGELNLLLSRQKDQDALCMVEGPDALRQISCRRLGKVHRAFLLLALELPAAVFCLLEQEALRFPEEMPWPEAFEREVLLFTRSGLGSFLWSLVSNGQPMPSARSLRRDAIRYGLPLPPHSILADLHLLPAEETDKFTLAVFDTELSRLMGLNQLTWPKPVRKIRPRAHINLAGETDADIAGRIKARVFIDGLPRFPEQYLYDHYRPPLREYCFEAPLQRGDEFFGRVQLVDRSGQIIEVDHPDSARALLLASFSNTSATALPIDPQLTAAILTRYLADLDALHRELRRQCHLHVDEKSAADALVERIWQSLPLPPWGLCIETL